MIRDRPRPLGETMGRAPARVPLLCSAPLIWLAVVPSPLGAGIHSSPPPADSVHFCRVFDYEQWRDSHPLPAAKRLTDLSTGEPRTVRMIYFLPNDRPYRQEVVEEMKVVIRRVQTFYAEWMRAHGYGSRTFLVEADVQGEPVVHRLDGQHPDSHYLEGGLLDEVGQTFDVNENIYLIVVDNSTDLIGRAGGAGGRWGKRGGFGAVPGSVHFGVVAHELGHAFGLWHDFRDDAYIMSYGNRDEALSACHAEFLAVHPYFNPAVPTEEGQSPTIELISPRVYPAGSERVSIQLEARDPEGLHQVILFTVTETGSTWGDAAAGNLEVKECRGLDGAIDAVIEFEYDGVVPSSPASSLSSPPSHPLRVAVVDSDGNVTSTRFLLAEISPHLVGSLEGYEFPVNSVMFSPDGTTLASGSWDGVKLWDMTAREEITTLEGVGVASVVFSSDGATLASGSADRMVRLWDVSTRAEIATLRHTRAVESVAISPDGTTLASGSRDGTVRLWDVSAREEIALLDGHTQEVGSVAISSDGTTLASGSWDRVRLWDMTAREEIATLEVRGVQSVVFSPDGATLALGSADGMVRLWDVAAQEEVSILSGHINTVTSVVFSPDGAILASGSVDQKVTLWDVAAREEISAFGHTDVIRSLSFSPDGSTLSAGSEDAILLWDVSEWTGRPRPFALEIISGDAQQGSPGAALEQPLIVEVRDQYGDPLPEATVTFTVTTGGGKLRGRARVEHVTTDPAGRAELILTLGPDPGTNTVDASIDGGEVATFHAQGVGITVTTRGEGDYRTWHLPDEAMARLGKGAIVYGDRTVAFSPDGRCLAVASDIGVWLYEVATARVLALLPAEGRVLSMALSPVGTTLASGLANGGIELWEVETGTRIATLEGREGYRGRITSVVFSPDGATLAAGAADGLVRLWDVAAREGIATLEGDENGITSMAFCPDGATLASGASGRPIKLWDLSSREEVATLEGPTGGVQSVVFSPDGATLASGEGETVKLWDVSSRRMIATLQGHGRSVFSVVFSPDGATLASGSWDGMVKLWDVPAQEEIATLEGHTDGVGSLAISADGTTLASASRDGSVRLWDLSARREIATLEGHWGAVGSVAFSPDGVILASGSGDMTVQDRPVRLWDVTAWEMIATLEGDGSAIHSVVFSPDGATLASGSGGGLRLWDVAARQEIATLAGYGDGVRSVAISSKGTTLASGSRGGHVRLWDVSAREEIASLEGHTDGVESVTFSPDGATLASGSADGTVRLWSVSAREEIAILLRRRFAVESVAFSPDGAALASGSRDRTVRLWDMSTRAEIATLEGHTSTILSVAFSPDGATLASGSWDGRIKLWDVLARREIAELKGHAYGDWDLSVAFSPDGTTLASGSQDGTVLLWDMQLLQPRPHTVRKLSGDDPRGSAGGGTIRSLVVGVLDQYGNPFAGAVVTFRVTAGDGTLSATTVTTDAEGRAVTTLTLGSSPGRNTVTASVAELPAVIFSAIGLAIPTTLAGISGDEQEGPAGTQLADPFLVEVRDQDGQGLAGVRVTFVVTAGGGTLSATTATTDADGRAASTLTLGSDPGTITVSVSVAGLDPVAFTATAEATPDFDGDGVTGFSDFYLFAAAFGGSDPRFDLDGSGTVDFADFFLFTEAFGQPARTKLLAMARERIGLPDGPQLQQNAPNPFNGGTLISWFLLQDGPARLEVHTLTGQRVRILRQGPHKAGLHRLRWNGRDDRGRSLASGVYVYRLVTTEAVQVRKLTLLR